MKNILFKVTCNSSGDGFYCCSENIPGTVEAHGDSLEQLEDNTESAMVNYYGMAMIQSSDMEWELRKGWKNIFHLTSNADALARFQSDDFIVNGMYSDYEEAFGTLKEVEIELRNLDSGIDERLMMYMNDEDLLTKDSLCTLMKLNSKDYGTTKDLIEYFKDIQKKAKKYDEVDAKVALLFVKDDPIFDSEGEVLDTGFTETENHLASIGEEVSLLLGYL